MTFIVSFFLPKISIIRDEIVQTFGSIQTLCRPGEENQTIFHCVVLYSSKYVVVIMY